MKPYNEYQKALCQNGYSILKIKCGEKACYDNGWPDKNYCKKPLSGILRNAQYNIGIKTKLLPAIDIDVTDPKIALEIKSSVSKLLNGSILYRTGREPKLLIPCQLKGKPFSKTTTGKWGDHCVEILSNGQQYVAFGEHPDTNNEYTWEDKSLLDTKASRLPKLDDKLANKIIELCCGVFSRHGLEQSTKSKRARGNKSLKPTKKVPKNDPVLKELEKLGLLKHERDKGKFELTECPFYENHTEAGGNWKGGAFYSQIGVHGNNLPFFHCCHAGCVDMQWRDLRKYLEITLTQVLKMKKEVFK